MKRWLLLILCLQAYLLASDAVVYSYAPILDFSAEPTTLVHGCVNVTTGAFSYRDPAISMQGGEPLGFTCFYNQKALRGNCRISICWSTDHPTENNLQDTTVYNTHGKPKARCWKAHLEVAGGGYIPLESPWNTSTLEIHPSLYQQGLTNYGFGELSGKTNLKNMRLYARTGGSELMKGDGGILRYGADNLLSSETKPNGNQIRYIYSGQKLSSIHAYDSSGATLLNTLSFEYLERKNDKLLTIHGSNGQWTRYQSVKKMADIKDVWVNRRRMVAQVSYFAIAEVCSNHHPTHNYHYNKSHDRALTCNIAAITYPEGRGLQINYTSEKVSALQAPLGPHGEYRPIYHFSYGRNLTQVRDALGSQTHYHFTPQQRLDRTERYVGDKLYSAQKFFWSDKGDFLGKALLDEQNKALAISCNTYDARGNIIEERLLGNLTGAQDFVPFSLSKEGIPSVPVECYSKKKTYSTDGFNLLLAEEEDDGSFVTYSYYPQSDRLRAKFIYLNGQIAIREFYEYNSFGACTKETRDDGVTPEENDLRGVTTRDIVRTKVNLAKPGFGLPHTVTHSYLDPLSGTEKQLKRIVYTWGTLDKITSESLFDANDQFQYRLDYTYDEQGNLLAASDPLGRVTHFSYDANFNKIREEKEGSGYATSYEYDYCNRCVKETESHESGRFETTYSYDANGHRTSVTDRYGQVTKYEYDACGREAKVIYPNNSFETKSYNIADQVVATTDRSGFTTRTDYNAYGKQVAIDYPDGSSERFEYYKNGMLAQKTERNGKKTKVFYDALKRVVREEEADKVRSYTYNGLHLLSMTDAMGQTTEYRYDGAGRRTAQIEGERVTSYEYDGLGRLSATCRGDVRTVSCYDALDRVIETREMNVQGEIYSKKGFVYDINGNISEEHTWLGPSTCRVEKTQFNAENLPIRKVSPEGYETTYHYEHVFYNDRGQKVLKKISVDPLGYQTVEVFTIEQASDYVETYNPAGLRTSRQQCSYDAKGQLIKKSYTKFINGVAEADYIIEWSYDGCGQITALSEQNGLKTTRSSYLNGQLAAITKPSGIILHHEYDIFGRLIHLRSSDGTLDCSYTYDLNDNLLISKNKDLEVQALYNRWDEKICERFPEGAVSCLYDPLGRLTKLILPDQKEALYCYRGPHLVAITYAGYTHSYLESNWEGRSTRSELIGQGGELLQSWDICGRCYLITHPSWSEEVQSFDKSGDLLALKILDPLGGLYSTYTYDDHYQLQSEQGGFNHQYLYDSINNRLKQDETPYVVNALNQIVSDGYTPLKYDSDGNLIQWGDTSYSYDALNRLIAVEKPLSWKAVYTYDTAGRRLSKTLFTYREGDWSQTEHLSFFYQGDHEIGALQNGQIVQRRILGRGKGADLGAAVVIELQGELFAPLHDHRGSVCALLDAASGKVCESRHYSAFGESEGGSLDNPWGFASKRLDEESGFICFHKRYYSPSMGCFITTDPLDFADGPNLYAYVHNNPLSSFDPYGLFSFKEGYDYFSEKYHSPQVQGSLQALGGLAEACIGGATTCLTGGLAAPLGWPVMAHGLDHFFTGMNTAITGTYRDSVTSTLLQKSGMSSQTAHFVDGSISLAGAMGGAALVQGGRAAVSFSSRYLPVNSSSSFNQANGPILFGQKSVSPFFSEIGTFKSKPLSEIVWGLKNGTISREALPVQVIIRNGQKVTLNNRSLLALRRAGMEPCIIDKTGLKEFEGILDKHLRGAPPSDVIRIRGGPSDTSLIN